MSQIIVYAKIMHRLRHTRKRNINGVLDSDKDKTADSDKENHCYYRYYCYYHQCSGSTSSSTLFYKQSVCKQLVLGWQIVDQLSVLNSFMKQQ